MRRVLASRRDTTDVGDAKPDEVDQAFVDQRDDLVRVVDDLAHRKRR